MDRGPAMYRATGREIPEALRRGIVGAIRIGRYTAALRIARVALRAVGRPRHDARALVALIARDAFRAP